MSWTSVPRTLLYYYGVVVLLGMVAFVVSLFVMGGGRPTGPGLFFSLAVVNLGVVCHLLYRTAQVLSEPDPPEEAQVTGRRRKELQREYQALKRALKELELDHAMGKLSEGDYGEIRARYRERAVRVLRQLDQAESYRKQIEMDLRARTEALAMQRGTEAPARDKTTPACPSCGQTNDADAAFCKKCGVRLGARAAEA
ncbi:MAG: zinc ribbon domain-containing protein [Myxococcales bacterium]|nr:zinc ribbon domain-containing protein [Myxococcota bacterium]MDW8281886.1 zinc ribbon domain-containing protein [Myxococcales bacterium]